MFSIYSKVILKLWQDGYRYHLLNIYFAISDTVLGVFIYNLHVIYYYQHDSTNAKHKELSGLLGNYCLG